MKPEVLTCLLKWNNTKLYSNMCSLVLAWVEMQVFDLRWKPSGVLSSVSLGIKIHLADPKWSPYSLAFECMNNKIINEFENCNSKNLNRRPKCSRQRDVLQHMWSRTFTLFHNYGCSKAWFKRLGEMLQITEILLLIQCKKD